MKTQSIELDGNDKLHWLRRLDHDRNWEFLDERRCCSSCGKSFTGRQVRLIGGSRPFGPLRAVCPTRDCEATPSNWIYPHEALVQANRLPQFHIEKIIRIKRMDPLLNLPLSSPESLRRNAFLRVGFRLLRHVGVVTQQRG